MVGNDNTVRYKNLSLQIPAGRHRHHYVKAKVSVHEYPDGDLAVFHGPRCLARAAWPATRKTARRSKAAKGGPRDPLRRDRPALCG